MILNSPIISGSLTVTGNIIASGSITLSGSVASASFATSASNATNAISASYANNLTVAGTLTAQTLVVQTITSSVLYSSGSNIFGNNIANTQTFTGSMNLTGSLTVVTTGTEFQVTNTGVNLGNALTDSHVISGSLRVNPNGLFVSSSGNVGINTTSSITRFNVNGTSDSAGRVARFTNSLNSASIEIGHSGNGGVIGYASIGSGNLSNVFYVSTGTGTLGSGIVMDNDGQVGIGTRIPSTSLTVKSSNGNGYALTRPSNDTVEHWRLSTTETGGDAYTVAYNTFNNEMIFTTYAGGGTGGNIFFRTGGTSGTVTERIRITSGGTIISQGGNIVLGSNNNASFSSTTAYTLFIANAGAEGAVAQGQIAFGEVTGFGINTNRIGAAITTTFADTFSRLNLSFRTKGTANDAGPVERMVISSAGVVTVASALAGQLLNINNTRNNGSGDFNLVTSFGSNNANTNSYHYIASTGGADRFYVFGNGNVQNTNGSYGTISDIKLKENIVDATPKLDKLMQVRIVNYNLINDPELKQIGVIAQELEQVFPGLIDEYTDRDKEGNDLGTTTKSVKMSVFVPILIKSIQELKAQNDDLQSQINELKAQ